MDIPLVQNSARGTQQPMRELPQVARIYILTIFGLGVLSATASLGALYENPLLVIPTFCFLAIVVALDLLPINFHRGMEVTLSTAIKVAGVILYPPAVIVLATFGGTLLVEWWLKRARTKLIFNVGSMTVISLLMTLMYTTLHQSGDGILKSASSIIPLVALGIGDMAINPLLIAMIIALTSRQRVFSIWAQTCRPLILHDLTMLPIGIFIAILWEASPWTIVLAAVPLLLVRQAYQIVVDLQSQTREALMALARVLDARDEATARHSELVAKYAEMIAHTLDLPAEEIDVIIRAAWLHDIGKIGMRNDILYKPGMLSPEEREAAKHHAKIGGELLTKFPLFEKGSVYVRHHHEWWNGKGYPDGLAGEKIPLGARIMAVADSFEAMTAVRPYRKPMSEQAAFEQLRKGMGTQFDPRVVEAFLLAKGVSFPKISDGGNGHPAALA